MKVCPNCGKQYPDDANFCPVDAGRLTPVAASAKAEAKPKKGTPKPGAPTGDGAADGKKLGGRFELGEHIGGGLTGEVHRATDTRTSTACVVKMVDESVFPTGLLLQRTERELKQLARLSHAGIVKILDHGRDGKTLWIASELCEGRSLHDAIIDDGAMDVVAASKVIAALGQALTAAAKVGVTHRDLAPKNILITPKGQVKIINFGVASPGHNDVPGVPEFVAPETIEGKSVDQRANIYSLGAVFYFLLTGQPPYQGEPERVHEQHLEGEVAPPSALRDDIPEMVDAVVLKSLERQSRHRFMTLRQLLTDVDQLAKGEFEMKGPGVSQRLARATGKGRERKKALSQTRLGFSSSTEEAITLPKKDDKADGAPDAKVDAKADGAADGKADSDADAKPDSPAPAEAKEQAESDKVEAKKEPESKAASRPAKKDIKLPGAGDQPETPSSTLPMDLGKASAAADAADAPAAAEQPPPAAQVVSDAAPADAQAPVAGEAGASSKPRAPTLPPEQRETSREEAKRRAEERIKRRKQGGDKGKFRETLWFKKGEMDAEAAARAEAAQKSGQQALDKSDMMPMEDRYEDDGSLTRGDREKFSLKTGGTQNMDAFGDGEQPVSAASSLTDAELINEMKGGRGKIIVFLVIGLLAIVGIVIFAATSGGHDTSEEKPAKPEIELPPEPPPVDAAPVDAMPVDAAPVEDKASGKKKKKKRRRKKKR